MASPGTPIKQHMAAGEEPDEQLLDHVVLADDDLADLGPEPLIFVRQGGDRLAVVRLGMGGISGIEICRLGHQFTSRGSMPTSRSRRPAWGNAKDTQPEVYANGLSRPPWAMMGTDRPLAARRIGFVRAVDTPES